jgi:hypothetical protein
VRDKVSHQRKKKNWQNYGFVYFNL